MEDRLERLRSKIDDVRQTDDTPSDGTTGGLSVANLSVTGLSDVGGGGSNHGAALAPQSQRAQTGAHGQAAAGRRRCTSPGLITTSTTVWPSSDGAPARGSQL